MHLDLREDGLTTAVRVALGRPEATLGAWTATAPPHRVENMTTRALARAAGTTADGEPFAVFAKVLQPASASPLWRFIPPVHHEEVLRVLDWLDEPRVYRSPLADDLPNGVRLPRLLHLEEHEGEIVLWLEALPQSGEPWDEGRYRRAAYELGRVAGRWPEARVTGELGLGRRDLGGLFAGRIVHEVLPRLRGDELWATPEVQAVPGAGALRRALLELAEVTPELVAQVEALPHGLGHGDASPTNLLCSDDEVVLLDWSYGASAPLGSDLAQLLAGWSIAGAPGDPLPEDLPALAAAVVPAYGQGLADEGVAADEEQLRLAAAVHLLVRSGFSALVLERPDLEAPEHAEERVALVARRAPVAALAVALCGRQPAAL